jgi:hypothetical protein
MATRIATTRSQDLQALGTAGQLAIESWGALTALLARELSPAHAALLAEPAANPARGEVDWYGAGEALPLTSLPQAQREAAQARLDDLVGAIVTLADRLRASRSDGDRFLGDMLALAIQVPGPDFVRVQGNQPVLVAWGHARSGPAAERVTLTGRLRAKPAAMAILPPPPSPFLPAARREHWRWLGVSVLASALALSVLWLDPFVWFGAPVPDCRAMVDQAGLAATLRNEAAREGALRLDLARLASDAGQRRLLCPPSPAPPRPLPAAVSPAGDAGRAERQGARSGKLQVILAWDDRDDLDLHVVCPDGADIGFHSRSACGGTLDVDANGEVGQLTDTPVENVYFTDPPPGLYRVVVDPYDMRARAATPFRVTIRRDGWPDEVVTGTATSGEHFQPVTEFTVAAP